jgi:hypothetical protein
LRAFVVSRHGSLDGTHVVSARSTSEFRGEGNDRAGRGRSRGLGSKRILRVGNRYHASASHSSASRDHDSACRVCPCSGDDQIVQPVAGDLLDDAQRRRASAIARVAIKSRATLRKLGFFKRRTSGSEDEPIEVADLGEPSAPEPDTAELDGQPEGGSWRRRRRSDGVTE